MSFPVWSLWALRQWMGSPSSWMVCQGSQVVYGLSKTSHQYNPIYSYSPNGVVLTVHRLPGSIQMWYSASDVHADVVLTDIQMGLV